VHQFRGELLRFPEIRAVVLDERVLFFFKYRTERLPDRRDAADDRADLERGMPEQVQRDGPSDVPGAADDRERGAVVRRAVKGGERRRADRGSRARGEDRLVEQRVRVRVAARVAARAGVEAALAPRLEDPSPEGGREGGREGGTLSARRRGALAADGRAEGARRPGRGRRRDFVSRASSKRGGTHSKHAWWTFERSSRHAHGVGDKNSGRPSYSQTADQQMRQSASPGGASDAVAPPPIVRARVK
jgi:hypothetical protein